MDPGCLFLIFRLRSCKEFKSLVLGKSSANAGFISNNSSLTRLAYYLFLNSRRFTVENFRSYLNLMN